MTTYDLAKKLFALAKRAPMVNYQENELLKTAARRLEESQRRIDELREQVAVLEERVAIMTENEPGADGSFDPPEDDFIDGAWPEIRFE